MAEQWGMSPQAVLETTSVRWYFRWRALQEARQGPREIRPRERVSANGGYRVTELD